MQPTDACKDIKCDNFAVCQVMSAGQAKCVCPDESKCSRTMNLVCGSDGKSYLNECVMKARACKGNKSIQVQSQGYCGKSIYIFII